MTIAAIPAGLLAPRTRRDSLLRPTLAELWMFLAVVLPALAALIATLPTVDLAYQLRAGADILAGRGIPSVDGWTFTAAGQSWLDQQWGAQALLAAAYQAIGWAGLAVVRATLVAVIFALVLAAIRRRVPGIGSRTAAWLTLGAFLVAAPALALRPQLLGMVCFAASLVLIAGRRTRPGAVWLVPLVAVVWANVHGSFVLAPVLVGLAWLEDAVERRGPAPSMLTATIATALATLVTPFGLDGWRYAAGLAANLEVRARISEWQLTTPTDVPGVLFWLSVALVIGALAWLARRGRLIPWPALVTLIAFAALGAMAQRGIAWWALVTPVVLAGALPAPVGALPAPAAAEPRRPGGNALNAALGGALIVAVVVMLPVWRPADPATGAPSGLLAYAPPRLTASLVAITAPSDRVWNPQVWGSWFEFAAPNPSYAFDSRIELIPAASWADGDTVARVGPGWDELLDRYGATIVVVDGPPTSPLAIALDAAGWHREFADDDGSIWARGPVAGVGPGLSSGS